MPISEYAQFVDYSKMGAFKEAMVQMGLRTLNFPNRWGVSVNNFGEYRYGGTEQCTFKNVTEGLGNKNWISGWMEKYSGEKRTFLDGIGIDTMLMAINDLIAVGAMPVMYSDEVASGRSDWFADSGRINDLTNSFYRGCKENGVALPQGESPSLKFLINTVDHEDQRVDFHCPSFSGTVTGRKVYPIRGFHRVAPGSVILGSQSSEWHCNGASLIIKRAMGLPEKFMTKLPNGMTLGEQALTPTRSYVDLVDSLLLKDIDVHGFQPITGGGISKLTAASRHGLTYHVQEWPFEVPPTCEFMREIGVTFYDCLTTFNWGLGYAVFVPKDEVNKAIDATNGDLKYIGVVAEGPRQVIFHPADDMVLPPPGD